MKSSVIVFPGSNCDRDVAVALEKLQFKNSMIWHKETVLPKSDLIVVPGGFSYGDYLRSGAIAAKSNILNEVIKAGKKGSLILGICNGFQILIECGLLQGALLRNSGLKFISKDIFVKVQSNKNKFFNKYKINEILKLNIAHNEGNFFTNKEHLKELEDNDLIPIKYCDRDGKVSSESNPNGSLNNIAGIFNKNKNILGMMPHPERMTDKICSDEDGLPLFLSLMN
tara:strand:- start:13019 stop:13696 length:678 start_codon:yes stop_codon:yes gene_type:complete